MKYQLQNIPLYEIDTDTLEYPYGLSKGQVLIYHGKTLKGGIFKRGLRSGDYCSVEKVLVTQEGIKILTYFYEENVFLKKPNRKFLLNRTVVEVPLQDFAVLTLNGKPLMKDKDK